MLADPGPPVSGCAVEGGRGEGGGEVRRRERRKMGRKMKKVYEGEI